ncbi:hypothetical protein [Dyadobacter sp. CY356]|uniref:hypothetical protein n=1 Tax=Dyadobacter sp. CY356 TaxID=2906442 RepID=UPI001F43D79C|nr:hypothetical protein [Dyadobacter sp. CY356]MCF0054163.1 hypothetical protein [Dyadobacter sp. CY356]
MTNITEFSNNLTELTDIELEEVTGGESGWYWVAYYAGSAWRSVTKTGGESIGVSGAMN